MMPTLWRKKRASPSVDFDVRNSVAFSLSNRRVMVVTSVSYSTCGGMPVTINASVSCSLHRKISLGVYVLLGQPVIEESASRLMMTFVLSSIREISLRTRHFEAVVTVVLGKATPSRLLSESKHSRRLILLDSVAHLATSVFTSAFAENANVTLRTKARNEIGEYHGLFLIILSLHSFNENKWFQAQTSGRKKTSALSRRQQRMQAGGRLFLHLDEAKGAKLALFPPPPLPAAQTFPLFMPHPTD